MAGSKRYSPIRGRVMRLTRLDGCGRPVYGEDSQVVSSGFVTASYSAQNDAGEAVRVTNANGDVCVNEAGKPTFNGYSIDIAFCQVDPALFSMATGQEVELDPVTGEAIGFNMDEDIDPTASAFALEIWTGVPAVECSDAGQGTFGYVLTPFVKGGVFGDFTIENGAITFSITGATTRRGSGWGNGPYNVQLDALGDPGPLVNEIKPGQHLRNLLVEVAPPTDAAGAFPLLDPTDSAITSFTSTNGDVTNEIDFVPVPAAPTEPVVYDFGDDTWAYDVGGVISHVYAAPGTYTVVASRGSSSVSTVLTVPIV